ncbi:unnamed protein product [Darwinula stevensoni]|uniref:Uncharacterized protein n=1 Tax=Darwinula stevensoni TaxID=69355 RepID=A0A7R9FTE5_9CRUS|nr:unnamed protein product [Darwinula stevensoni]CAG0905943.1 unnamed protein product [Darwinula stevensoni]
MRSEEEHGILPTEAKGGRETSEAGRDGLHGARSLSPFPSRSTPGLSPVSRRRSGSKALRLRASFVGAQLWERSCGSPGVGARPRASRVFRAPLSGKEGDASFSPLRGRGKRAVEEATDVTRHYDFPVARSSLHRQNILKRRPDNWGGGGGGGVAEEEEEEEEWRRREAAEAVLGGLRVNGGSGGHEVEIV